MRLLAENSSIITREIAIRISIMVHIYCVIGLIEKGFMKLKNFLVQKPRQTIFTN